MKPDMRQPDDALERAAALILDADGILIAAGTGMGVDSGLPDFRGTSGFWRAYPPLAKLKLAVIELGAGMAIPSVRRMAESQRVPVIRINPRAAAVQDGVPLEMGALDVLRALATRLGIEPDQAEQLST